MFSSQDAIAHPGLCLRTKAPRRGVWPFFLLGRDSIEGFIPESYPWLLLQPQIGLRSAFRALAIGRGAFEGAEGHFSEPLTVA
jgi:hypothetical protein